MCGIAGIIGDQELNIRSGSAAVRRMLSMIRHRGPDQFGVYQDTGASLGSARLSIIDLSTGQQPISNEDGTLWIVYNGEIFNYLELRSDLIQRGHRFSTHTDTEVLLHLYEEYGEDCLQRLNGQFAAAIWDAKRQRLFLARDRMGVRPIFYTETNGRFLFASEVKALLAGDGVSVEIDPVVLDQSLVYWSPLPGRTIFKGIKQVPPGHYLMRSAEGTFVKCYWSLSFPDANETSATGRADAGALLEEFKALLDDATMIRLRSDVPVGAYLSGGLDSSIIARIISSRSDAQLATFSVAFEDPNYDESAFQLRMAQLLGTRHEVVFATQADIARAFESVVWHCETPVTRTAPAPMLLLSELVRECGIKVVLSGEGADECLAGYDLFKEAAIRSFCARQPGSEWRPKLLARLYPDIARLQGSGLAFLEAFFRTNAEDAASPYFSHLIRWRNNARSRRFYSEYTRAAIAGAATFPEVDLDLPDAFARWGALQQGQYLESRIFLSEYLLSSQGDRVAMANSVESRHPFLDYRLVEFCSRLPTELKLRGLQDKRILRQYGKEILPPEVWQRPKRPYRAPIHASLFCESAPDYIRECLSTECVGAAGLFKPEAVKQLVGKVERGGRLGETDDMALAGILSAQLIHQKFVSAFKAEPAIPEGARNLKVCSQVDATAA